MSNHSGSYMVNDLLKLMDQEHLFEDLGMEKTQSLIRRFVGIAQAYDCNGGEILENLTDRFQPCYCCLANTQAQDLNDGLYPRCRGEVD